MKRSFLLKALFLSIAALALNSFVYSQRMAVANNPITVDVEEYLGKIELPPGFAISVYANDVLRVRSLAVSESGTVYGGSRGQIDNKAIGNIYAIPDTNGDQVADTVNIIAENLDTPSGVALHDGDLYIAEINQILRIEAVETKIDQINTPTIVKADLPTERHHGWKFIGFGPDNKLYVPVGAPCNTCAPSERHALIARMDSDGSNYETFASGIRNTVGVDWHPQTGDLWFTDNGRDMWGDDRPPEELNRATQAGQHFGFPFRYGTDLEDGDFKTEKNASEFTSPMLELPAHTAGLGMRFYTGDAFPEQYRGDIFIAYHGSWNRSSPAGYLIMRVDMEGNEVRGHEVFAKGWLQDEKYWGRPVDIDFLNDGSMIVSDDHANVIYRIRYTGE